MPRAKLRQRVAGAFLAAAKLLDGQAAKFTEIDEGFFHLKFSVLERVIILAERKALYEELHPETKHGGDRRSVEAQVSEKRALPFCEYQSQKSRVSPRTIQRAVYIAQYLDPEARQLLKDTPLADKEGELRAIAHQPAKDQRRIVTLLLSGKPDAPASVSNAVGLLGAGQLNRSTV